MLLSAGSVSAQDASLDSEYIRRIQVAQTLPAHGETPFGAQVNAYTGDLTFQQPEITLPGTGPTIELVRSYNSGQWRDGLRGADMLGDWTLSIPRIETLTDAPLPGTLPVTDPGLRWVVHTAGGDSTSRCMQFDRPAYQGTLDDPAAGWNGMQLITADGNRQAILKRSAQNATHPTAIAETGTFPAVTSGNWQISCLPATSNGEEGEAFLAVAPDGTKYWFDHLTGARAPTIREQDAVTGVWLQQGRMLARMYVSRVQDRFGNTLTFTYNGDRLTAIGASDGRQVAISWRSDAPLIDHVTVEPGSSPARVWRYEYLNPGSDDATLAAVVLPDGSRWTFALAGLGGAPMTDLQLARCDTRTLTGTGTPVTSTLTAPSGLVGTFVVTPLWHARSLVPSTCSPDPYTHAPRETIPPVFGNAALTRKTLSGPGMAERTWTYAYAPAAGSTTRDACAAAGTCDTTTWVDITDPAGNRTRHTYSNRWGETEGKLLRSEAYAGSAELLRTTSYEYAASTQGPWPALLGDLMLNGLSNEAPRETWTPLKTRAVIQQGVTFTHAVGAFDAYAQETSATDDSTLGEPRQTLTQYHTAVGPWVLGQVAQRTVAGKLAEQTTFDAQHRPWKRYRFGKLVQTLGYYAGSDVTQLGTLRTVTDGNGNTTTYTDWHRGTPRAIDFADGTGRRLAVNDFGWVTGVTDETGAATGYAYDAMGRITAISYPAGDSVAWAPTTIGYASVGAAEYGIAAGHWRQTVSTGNARTITYFDALWRPVLVREYDAANVAGTQRFNATSYALSGQADYRAYPMANAPGMEAGYWTQGGDPVGGMMSPMGSGDPEHCYPWPACEQYPDDPPPSSTLPGVHTTFDALGRVVRVDEDSELGVLATVTEYLAGFQSRVTNARGHATTTSYLAWDAPTTEFPTRVAMPEGAWTHITRDDFGKPTRIRRSDSSSASGGTVWVNRYYAYNSNEELCRIIDPESGTTLLGYDGAGNLTWSAAGLPAGTNCDREGDTATILARKAVRTYDARNRVKTLAFPDLNGNQSWTYTPDGLPETVTTTNSGGDTTVVNAYSYNQRRLLTGESQAQTDGQSVWHVGYAYSPEGHRAAIEYPQLLVDYAPDALGQPTHVTGQPRQAGSPLETYATGIGFFPNGALKQFTYGNGIVHTMTRNARGLPEESKDAYGSTKFLHDVYDYDQVGNVAAITDGASADQHGNRTMTYDGLDRLTDVTSPMYGSTGAHYSYDVLDNLTRVVAPGRDHGYCYGSNRLAQIRQGSCSGALASSLAYDVQGNLATRDGTAFTFDYGNRLRATAGETYRYDAWGRRTLSTSAQGQLYTLYSREGQLLWVRDERDQRRREYIYLQGSLLLQRRRPIGDNTATLLYQHTDALGSPVVVTDQNRTIHQTSQYEPYGKLLNRPMNPSINYAGHFTDPATGLSYMQQRYFDPGIGQFLSVDPVTVDSAGGNFNRYWYANNNPYRFTDPDGRQAAQACSDACMRMRATSDGGIREALGQARASTRGELIEHAAKGYIDSQAALGQRGRAVAHFFADDFIDATSNFVDGNYEGAARNLAMALVGKRIKALRAAPEKLATDMRNVMISISGGRKTGAARDFHDATHIGDRTAAELATDFIDVARSHGISEAKIPRWIRKMADE